MFGFDFDAGKYAVYVWTAYGATALVFLAITLDSIIRAWFWRRRVERLEAQRDARHGQ